MSRIALGWSTIGTFSRDFHNKFKVAKFDYYSESQKDEPMVLFGYYIRDDKKDNRGIPLVDRILGHRSLLVIVWSGSDSMDLDKKVQAVQFFRENKHRVFHIAHSHWIRADLKAAGLDVIDRVVFPVTFENFVFTEGHDGYVYHYHPRDKNRYPVYGTDVVNRLEKYNKIMFMKTCHGYIHRRNLHNTYKMCTFGIRLTDHDNMALSCVEMGLMGRYSIFNGNIPCALPYQDRDHAVRTLLDMYKCQPQPEKRLAKEMAEFVHDDMTWLNLKNYD